MLSKDQTEALEGPQADASVDILLVQNGGQKSLDPAPSAYLDNGGSNDPPDGRG